MFKRKFVRPTSVSASFTVLQPGKCLNSWATEHRGTRPGNRTTVRHSVYDDTESVRHKYKQVCPLGQQVSYLFMNN